MQGSNELAMFLIIRIKPGCILERIVKEDFSQTIGLTYSLA